MTAVSGDMLIMKRKEGGLRRNTRLRMGENRRRKETAAGATVHKTWKEGVVNILTLPTTQAGMRSALP